MTESQLTLASRLLHCTIKKEDGSDFEGITYNEIIEYFNTGEGPFDVPCGILKLSGHEFVIELSSSDVVSDLTRKMSRTAEWRGQPATLYSLVPASHVVKQFERAKKGEIPDRVVYLPDHQVKPFAFVSGADSQPEERADHASTPNKPQTSLSPDDLQTWTGEIQSLSLQQLQQMAKILGKEVDARQETVGLSPVRTRVPLSPHVIIEDPQAEIETVDEHDGLHPSHFRKTRSTRETVGATAHEEPAKTSDVSHLMHSLLTQGGTIRTGVPRVNTFSGEPTAKNDVSFEQWYFEIVSLIGVYNEVTIKEVITRSLKGVAADTARFVGPKATVNEILGKLSVIFGTVSSFDVMKQNFYSLFQADDETVPLFITRMESMLNKIMQQWPGKIDPSETQTLLKDRLFHGVRKPIRDSVRHHYDNPSTPYSTLVIAARKAEGEVEAHPVAKSKEKNEKEKAKVKIAATTVGESNDTTSILQSLQEQMAKQQEQLDQIMRGRGRGRGNYRGRGNGNSFYRGRGNGNFRGRGYRENGGRGYPRGLGGPPRGRGNPGGNPGRGNPGNLVNQDSQNLPQQAAESNEALQPPSQEGRPEHSNVQCYNCWEWGHISPNCPHLNQEGLLTGGV